MPRGDGRIPVEEHSSQTGSTNEKTLFSSTPGISRADILFISHCVPNPPDKGEKIRAFHLIHYLTTRYRVHLVCFARKDSEMAQAEALKSICNTVYVQKLPRLCLVRGAMRLLTGGCLNAGYYWSSRMKRHVDELSERVKLRCALVYSVVMMPYVGSDIPVILDMMDVDSEKWLAYAETHRPGFLYALEAKRLRQFESMSARTAKCTVLTTHNEETLLRSFAPDAATAYMENGVDVGYFDGEARPLPAEFEGRRFIAFIGTMNYYPNIEGVRWFAENIFPPLRRQDPSLEFFVIGRHPAKAVQKLASIEGVVVTGGVPDTRPFIAGALAVVAPLRIARGIQNKVIESLAMGRRVYTSVAVTRTFGDDVPHGVVPCASEREFVQELQAACREVPDADLGIRRSACARFSWPQNLLTINTALEEIIHGNTPAIIAIDGSITCE